MTEKIAHIKDQLLVMDARDGNKEAMEELVHRWHKKLWQYVYTLTLDSHAAWDISQQCWLAIIKGLRRLNDPACFKAWVYRIATNKSMDWLKKQSKEKHVNLDSIENHCCQRNDEQRITELIQQLKDESRAVLSLYYFEQLRIAEISITLNIPQGTVKSRLFKAREELKQLWKQYFYD